MEWTVSAPRPRLTAGHGFQKEQGTVAGKSASHLSWATCPALSSQVTL